MARITEAILSQDTAYAKLFNQRMTDLTHGGQFGYANNLVELVSNNAYIRRNLVCILLEGPRFFDLMPNPNKWYASLKSLVELHMKTWDGFKGGLTVETVEHAVGGAGEMQEEYVDVKRERTQPTSTVIEKYGSPIQSLLHTWITFGMMDPDTKTSMLGTLTADTAGSANRPSDLLSDWYTMSCLFFEPDPLHRTVVKSWVVTGMFPKGTGPIEGKRDLLSASELLELSLEWTGVAQFNLGGNVFAQKILDRININNANPYLRPSFIANRNAEVARSEEHTF